MLIIAVKDRFGLVDGCDGDLLVAKEKCGFEFDTVTGMLCGPAPCVATLQEYKSLLRDKLRITGEAFKLYGSNPVEPRSSLQMQWNSERRRFEVTFQSDPSWKKNYTEVKEGGFKFDKQNKVWWTKTKKRAAMFQHAADTRTIEEIGEVKAQKPLKPVEWDEAEHQRMLKEQKDPDEWGEYLTTQGWQKKDGDWYLGDQGYDMTRALWHQRDLERGRRL